MLLIPWIRSRAFLVGLLCGAVPCVHAQVFPAASFDLPGDTAALGDLDRDGKLDLVGERTTSYAFAKGDGLGGFAAPVAWDSGLTFFAADSVELVDVNSSGTLDVALLGHSTTATVGSGSSCAWRTQRAHSDPRFSRRPKGSHSSRAGPWLCSRSSIPTATRTS